MKCVFCSNFISVWVLEPCNFAGKAQLALFLPLLEVRDGHVQGGSQSRRSLKSISEAGQGRFKHGDKMKSLAIAHCSHDQTSFY